MRRWRGGSVMVVAGLIASVVLALPAPAEAVVASGPVITMTPSVLAAPARLTLGPDNNVWYTDQNGNGAGMVGFVDATTGAITRIATPSEVQRSLCADDGPRRSDLVYGVVS